MTHKENIDRLSKWLDKIQRASIKSRKYSNKLTYLYNKIKEELIIESLKKDENGNYLNGDEDYKK